MSQNSGTSATGRIHRLRASGPGAAWDGVRTGLLSARSKLVARRLLIDAMRARPHLALDDHAGRAGTDVETIGEYCDRRLNAELRDHLVDPLVHAFYLADAMNASVVQEHLRTPGAVPPGNGLLVAFWAPAWCTARLEVDDDTLAAEMLATIRRVLPGIDELVEFVAIDRWSPANPDLAFGNHRLFAELDRLAATQGRIALAGDYTGLPLIEGCVISGRDAARRLATAL